MSKKTNTTEAPETVAAPSKPKYAVGDWVYFAFELCQVKSLSENGEITGLSDGVNEVKAKKGQSFNKDAYPISAEVKTASEVLKSYIRGVNDAASKIAVNTPELTLWLIEQWHALIATKSQKEATPILNNLNRLAQTLQEVLAQVKTVKFFVNEVKTEEDEKNTKSFQLFAQ